MLEDTFARARMMTFSELFVGEYRYVLRGLIRLGVYERDARDVLQEVFLEVSHELERYDSERPLRPWLYAFMIRFAANYRRLARHKEQPGARASVPELREVGTEDASHIRDMVLRALETLVQEQRICVVMHDFEGFTAEEIAEVTHAALGTVYSRIRAGRERAFAEPSKPWKVQHE